MEPETVIAMVSIITAGFTIAVGSLGPALGEARAAAEALRAIERMRKWSEQVASDLGGHRD